VRDRPAHLGREPPGQRRAGIGKPDIAAALELRRNEGRQELQHERQPVLGRRDAVEPVERPAGDGLEEQVVARAVAAESGNAEELASARDDAERDAHRVVRA